MIFISRISMSQFADVVITRPQPSRATVTLRRPVTMRLGSLLEALDRHREARRPSCGHYRHNSSIWKPLKCYNHGIYLVYTRHMTKSVICKVYTWYIPVI